jgi:NAD(P)-dependent dehydrogenase (short-subunit alcohol dehydrogenase family)
LIEQSGGRAVAVRCDVTRSEDVRAALQQAVDVFGRLDVAFNNAGAEQAVKPAAETSEQEWDRIIAVNLRGVTGSACVWGPPRPATATLAGPADGCG